MGWSGWLIFFLSFFFFAWTGDIFSHLRCVFGLKIWRGSVLLVVFFAVSYILLFQICFGLRTSSQRGHADLAGLQMAALEGDAEAEFREDTDW